ncbi:ABC transporter ATP-binding protein [Micromonospora polyrhachis]|uniref:Molybdate transport system ATP-binding protein n=1 Tax=Micromonospora polyrhachis TaxID=1282883 RepID=A0A7W7STY3_9ACTN|nr:ABC transporter ATP-binding protein [Micromonospora polyrhachis]MBB4960833.1 molybdate transport system ATP-binding protein [Micromonospora polyrhachis]
MTRLESAAHSSAAQHPAGNHSPVVDAHLVVDRGAFRLDLALTLSAGEVVALVGPNGAGKSTVLRALAGLLPLHDGHIDLAGERVDEPGIGDSGAGLPRATRPRAGRFVPAERRPIGVVFQDYLLFPHLSALDNVAFGPRCRGVRKRDARDEAARWLARVGLTEYAHRRPRQLSGGQAQRVALARALAVRPALLLLDEPLAALDARTRLDTRAQLRQHLTAHQGATLLVTHDPLDALVLADRLLVVEDGRLVQQGDPAEVAARPRTEYVASLVGLNLYRGQADGHTVTLADGPVLTVADQVHGAVFVAFPPSSVTLSQIKPGDEGNTWPVRVTGVEPYGDNLRVRLTGMQPGPADSPTTIRPHVDVGHPADAPATGQLAADVSPAVVARLDLRTGARLWAMIDPATTRAYPAR